MVRINASGLGDAFVHEEIEEYEGQSGLLLSDQQIEICFGNELTISVNPHQWFQICERAKLWIAEEIKNERLGITN